MGNSDELTLETPQDFIHAVEAALRDDRLKAKTLLGSWAYRGSLLPSELRYSLAMTFLRLAQLEADDLSMLCGGIRLHELSPEQREEFFQAALSHPLIDASAVVALFHNNHPHAAEVAVPASNVADLATLAVARATAGRETVRKAAAVAFLEWLDTHTTAEVQREMAALLDAGEWSVSLWEAYAAAAAICNEPVQDPEGVDPKATSEWHSALG